MRKTDHKAHAVIEAKTINRYLTRNEAVEEAKKLSQASNKIYIVVRAIGEANTAPIFHSYDEVQGDE